MLMQHDLDVMRPKKNKKLAGAGLVWLGKLIWGHYCDSAKGQHLSISYH